MRKIVEGYKDENGAYVKGSATSNTQSKEEEAPSDLSIDSIMEMGLKSIWVAMKSVKHDIGVHSFDRSTIQNLKDLMTMLKELKVEEREILSRMSEEELKAQLKE